MTDDFMWERTAAICAGRAAYPQGASNFAVVTILHRDREAVPSRRTSPSMADRDAAARPAVKTTRGTVLVGSAGGAQPNVATMASVCAVVIIPAVNGRVRAVDVRSISHDRLVARP